MNLKTNPELLPLIEWWEKDGKQTLACCIAAAIAIGGWYGYKNYRAVRNAAASDSVATANTTAEIEEAVGKFSGMPVEKVQRLRLAKKYFDDARYDESLATYEALMADAPEGFGDVPVVGKAQCLEALGRYAEAQKAFDTFVAASPKHYLTLTAQLGSLRCQCEGGDKKGALDRAAALKEALKDDAMAKARIESTEELIKRYTPTITSKNGKSNQKS